MKSNLFTLLLVVFMSVSCQPKAQTCTIETSLGNIKVRLFESTPLHKENFEKLVAEQFYDSVLFHRIIPQFMIQTGNGATKTASAGERPAGDGDLGYTVPAEFAPENFHKKGALAAARTGDAVNPEKRSSCSQFYIVQGRIFSDEELNALENQMHLTFSEFQRSVYKTLGGAPFLDGNYTVFGEVTEGLDVVDKIASVRTGPGDWPLADVRIIRIVKN